MRTGSTLVVVLVLLRAAAAHAVDGVIEINQVRALAGGITDGDEPGFPVTISAPGSYRLTGNLESPAVDSDIIQVTASYVTIDLNGFRVHGPNSWAGPGQPCTGSGNGHGIFADTAYSGIAVTNGSVVGAPSSGIALLGFNTRVAGVRVEENCGEGIRVGNAALITACTALRNYTSGFLLGAHGRVASSLALRNRSAGVNFSNEGYLTVEDCVASGNGHDGILAGVRSTIRGNQVVDNDVNGIIAGDGAALFDNVVVDHPGSSISVVNGTGGSGGNVVLHVPGLAYSGISHLTCDLENSTKLCGP